MKQYSLALIIASCVILGLMIACFQWGAWHERSLVSPRDTVWQTQIKWMPSFSSHGISNAKPVVKFIPVPVPVQDSGMFTVRERDSLLNRIRELEQERELLADSARYALRVVYTPMAQQFFWDLYLKPVAKVDSISTITIHDIVYQSSTAPWIVTGIASLIAILCVIYH